MGVVITHLLLFFICNCLSFKRLYPFKMWFTFVAPFASPFCLILCSFLFFAFSCFFLCCDILTRAVNLAFAPAVVTGGGRRPHSLRPMFARTPSPLPASRSAGCMLFLHCLCCLLFALQGAFRSALIRLASLRACATAPSSRLASLAHCWRSVRSLRSRAPRSMFV